MLRFPYDFAREPPSIASSFLSFRYTPDSLPPLICPIFFSSSSSLLFATHAAAALPFSFFFFFFFFFFSLPFFVDFAAYFSISCHAATGSAFTPPPPIFFEQDNGTNASFHVPPMLLVQYKASLHAHHVIMLSWQCLRGISQTAHAIIEKYRRKLLFVVYAIQA